MKVVRILVLVLLVPTLAFAQYKIVLENGKVIEGKYLHEDQTNIFIESNGIQMNFKKEKLDLDKMKELNANVPAPEELRAQKPLPPATTAQKVSAKKPVRVYTSEDLKQMKEIWDQDSGKTLPGTEPVPATQTAPVTQPEAVTQPAPLVQTPPVTQTAPEAQTMPAASTEAAPAPEASPATAVPPVPEVPAGPRDEMTIRDEIATAKLQIAETEKRILDLRTKGRVTETWEKLLVKQQQKVQDLQQELKDYFAARKAAKRAAQTQSQQ